MICTDMLEAWGARVTAVRDGREAVDACAAEQFDLVLLDRYMDDMDGLTAAGHVRQLCPAAMILLLTTPAPAQAAGFDAILEKPLSIDTLTKAIQNQELSITH